MGDGATCHYCRRAECICKASKSCEVCDADGQLDDAKLGTAEVERRRAKVWMSVATQHLRNKEYWKERALFAEQVGLLLTRAPPMALSTVYPSRNKTDHQRAVEQFLVGFGHHIPAHPEVADRSRLLTQLNLIWEEFSELVTGLAVEMWIDPSVDIRRAIHWKEVIFRSPTSPNLVEIADACGDLMVVVTGMMSICGIADDNILREVNDNNLLKIQNGHLDPVSGKFIKPKDHPKPDILGRLRDQGCVSKIGEQHGPPGSQNEGSTDGRGI